jgi:hypothetical protein
MIEVSEGAGEFESGSYGPMCVLGIINDILWKEKYYFSGETVLIKNRSQSWSLNINQLDQDELFP